MSLEEEITQRAARRRAERAKSAEAILAEGYRPEEVETVVALRTRMEAWRLDTQSTEISSRIIREWSERLESEGKNPRSYRYFHTVIGSTLPVEGAYEDAPDLPGDDSIFVLAGTIEEALRNKRAA